MSDVYVGTIKTVAFTYAPQGYLPCNGQIVSINEYEALYALIGTTYGGDGQTTFALPNLNGRVPIHMGQGRGLSARGLGQTSGAENFTLNASQIPPHSHALNAVNATADQRTPGGNALAIEATAQTVFYSSSAPNAAMNAASIGVSGTQSPQSQSSIPPFLAINFIIAVEGFYPPKG